MRHLSWTEAHTDVLHGATLVWAVNSQLLSASFSVLPLLKLHAEEWDTIWRWWRAVHIEGKAACTELITGKKQRSPANAECLGSVEGHCCSVAKWCLTFCDPMDFSLSGSPVLHYLPELAQTHVHWVSDAIQPSHPLSSPSPPAFSLSQHQGLFRWDSSLHQVAKVLELELQHQCFQWIFRADFL